MRSVPKRNHLIKVAVSLLIIASSLVVSDPVPVSASHSTSCKWPFPWPAQVYYHVDNITFTAAQADRVEYGGNTWTEGGFNVEFHRVSSVSQSTAGVTRIYQGSVSMPNHLANTNAVWVGKYSGQGCNVDTGHHLLYFQIIFNQYANFHLDCLAVYPFCQNNDVYDIHNLTSHEFVHVLSMGHSSGLYDTSYGKIGAGETRKRTLAYHDKYAAWIMYGCRSGMSCQP